MRQVAHGDGDVACGRGAPCARAPRGTAHGERGSATGDVRETGACMNSEQLHYFELAYKERNFSAAARLVPCSPQGMAKSIHALEKELGVPLFGSDEVTGLPVPTEYAHELFEFAAVYDSNLRLLRESFDRISGSRRSKIDLACSLGVMGVLGPEFLASFSQCHPDIEVAYWEAADGLCEDSLRRETSDLGLIVSPAAPGMSVRELYRCPIYFWIDRASPLAGKDALDIDGPGGAGHRDTGRGLQVPRAAACRRRTPWGHAGPHLRDERDIPALRVRRVLGRGLGFTVRHLVRAAHVLTPRLGGCRAHACREVGLWDRVRGDARPGRERAHVLGTGASPTRAGCRATRSSARSSCVNDLMSRGLR